MNGAARPPFGEAFWQPFMARAGTFASRLTGSGVGFQEGDVIEEISTLLSSFDKRLAPILEIDGAGTIQFGSPPTAIGGHFLLPAVWSGQRRRSLHGASSP